MEDLEDLAELEIIAIIIEQKESLAYSMKLLLDDFNLMVALCSQIEITW